VQRITAARLPTIVPALRHRHPEAEKEDMDMADVKSYTAQFLI